MQKEQMDLDTAKKAIDFITINSKNRKNIEIDFFGGEPLLNFDVIKETVKYARKIEKEKNKNFRFTLTTNALLIDDEVIKFMNDEMDNVVLSLDGRKEINDLMRPTINDKGSYDIIKENILKTVKMRKEANKSYYVRGTFTSNNLDFHKDVEDFVKLGIDEISIEPVVASNDKQYAIKKEHINQIFESYDKLVDLYNEEKEKNNQFNFFHFNVDLDNDKCEYKKIAGCGAGGEYICVVPGGDIYPCHQFVGDENFIMGNIFSGIKNKKLRDDFYKCTLEDKQECYDCSFKYFCGGGCLANNYNFNLDINKPYDMGCEMLKKRMECALYLKVKEKNKSL